MIRLIALLIVAFLLPFAVHGIATLANGRGFLAWPSSIRGRAWVVAAGLILALITLFSLMGAAPKTLGERYVPAHMEGGVLVPERFEPEK